VSCVRPPLFIARAGHAAAPSAAQVRGGSFGSADHPLRVHIGVVICRLCGPLILSTNRFLRLIARGRFGVHRVAVFDEPAAGGLKVINLAEARQDRLAGPAGAKPAGC